MIRTGIAGRPTSDGRAPPPPLQDGLLTIVRPTREGPVATVPATKLTRHTHIQTHTQTHIHTHTHINRQTGQADSRFQVVGIRVERRAESICVCWPRVNEKEPLWPYVITSARFPG